MSGQCKWHEPNGVRCSVVPDGHVTPHHFPMPYDTQEQLSEALARAERAEERLAEIHRVTLKWDGEADGCAPAEYIRHQVLRYCIGDIAAILDDDDTAERLAAKAEREDA